MKRHLIGIGGVGMSALATALVRLGDEVTGADRTPGTPNIKFLESLGVKVFPDDGSGEVISVYYLTSDESGKSLGYEVFTPDASLPVDGRIDEILRRMKNPMNENNRSLIPEGVEVKEVSSLEYAVTCST